MPAAQVKPCPYVKLMRVIKSTTSLILVLMIASGAQAQKESGKKKDQIPSMAVPLNLPEDVESANAERRKQAISQIRNFIDRTWEFKSIRSRITTLVYLAELLWKEDEAQARQILTKAFDSLKGIEPQSATANEHSTGKVSVTDLSFLRRFIIRHSARLDHDLAQYMAEASTEAEESDSGYNRRAEMYLSAAIDLSKENPAKAVEFIERSFQTGITDTTSLLFTLGYLREKNEAIANNTYLKILIKLVSQPVVKAEDLLALGSYVFMPPGVDPAAYNTFRLTTVGKGAVRVGTINISLLRPGASPAIIRAYLDAAITILMRPISDPREKIRYYVAGYQLASKAQQFIPDRLPELNLAMASLIQDIPPELAEQSSYANLSMSNDDYLEDSLSNIEEISDEYQRDTKALLVAWGLHKRRDFARMRAVAEIVKDLTLRNKLLVLSGFCEAAKLIENGDLVSAEEKTGKLPPGVESSVLWLAVGRMRAKAGYNASARESIYAGLKDARRVEDARRPLLILDGAGLLAGLDTIEGLQTLSEAVKAFNKQEVQSWTRVNLWEEVHSRTEMRHFPLDIKQMEYNFANALPPLIEANSDLATSAILNLENEELLGQALIAAARTLLAKASSSASRPPSKTLKVSEKTLRKLAIKAILPAFPEEAKKRQMKGVVVSEVEINEKGNVAEVRILEAPDRSIESAVIEAIKQWRFNISTIKGEPVRLLGKLTFYYVIKDGKHLVENPREVS